MQFLDVSVKVVKVDMAERGGWRAEGEGSRIAGEVCDSVTHNIQFINL